MIGTLFRLQRLLGSVANNVNQLARKANVDDESRRLRGRCRCR